jgi:hypothetical protein
LIRVAALCSNFWMRVTWRAIAVFALFGGSPAVSLAQGAPPPTAAASSERLPAKSTARPPRGRSRTPDAILPGFETLADGSTRLFIEFSQPVTYDAKVSPGAITYVVKGARVDKRNNYNPLVTVDFNTPVTSARLVPHGRDLWFVVALRADVQPTVTMDAAKDGGAVLRIEFPKGDYVPSAPALPSSDSTPAPTASASAAPRQTGRSDR